MTATQRTCARGCGEVVLSPSAEFRPGHHWKVRRPIKLCECGCGQQVPNRSRFVRNHQLRLDDPVARFWAKTRSSDTGCIEWLASVDTSGYGLHSVAGRHHKAHRFAWETSIGAIPDGLVVDHLCRNRKCVNTAHMELVTNRVNVLRGVGPSASNSRRTHCVNGHEFTAENTIIRKSGNRGCRECKNAQARESRRRKS